MNQAREARCTSCVDSLAQQAGEQVRLAVAQAQLRRDLARLNDGMLCPATLTFAPSALFSTESSSRMSPS